MNRKQFYETRRAILERFTNLWLKVTVFITGFLTGITTTTEDYAELIQESPLSTGIITLALVFILFITILSLGITIKEILVSARLTRGTTQVILLLLVFTPLLVGSSASTQKSNEELFGLVPLSIEDSVRWVLRDKVNPYVVELLVAQSKHESGNYKNSLARHHNNLFGRHWSKSDTLAIGPGGKAEGHSRFSCFKSIRDATLSQYQYLQRKGYSFNWKSPKEFATELKARHYYEDNIYNYSNALTKHLTDGQHSSKGKMHLQKREGSLHEGTTQPTGSRVGSTL